MNDTTQARAYARSDFRGPNNLFMRLFREKFPDFTPAAILDLGCGPADITIRFAHLFPESKLTCIDGARRGERPASGC